MNDFCMTEMSKNLDKYLGDLKNERLRVLDLGSFDVNGTFKDLMPPTWEYVGIDIEKGPNVDVVMPSEYVVPLERSSFDVLISGSCLEHVRNPFRLMKEAVEVLKPEGRAIVMVPFLIVIHRYPLDCWRFLPDGMTSLFEESGLDTIDAYLITDTTNPKVTRQQKHCWGIGRKR